MKNILTLSLLATLVCVSANAAEPEQSIAPQTNIEVINDIYHVESIDADGRIHALIAIAAFNPALEVGSMLSIIDNEIAHYAEVESIEPSENPAYIRVVLSPVVFVQEFTEQE